MKIFLFSLSSILLLTSLPAMSQTAAGLSGLTGLVIDTSGAAVPHAEVVVDNTRLGIHRALKPTDSGVFNVPALVPSAGSSITVNAPGFAEFRNSNITTQVGQNVNVVAKLELASATSKVDVESSAPVVELKTDVSQNITQRQIDNLPINGRRVDSFALLSPGVSTDGTFGLLSFRGIAGGNNFMTDGNDTTEPFYTQNPAPPPPPALPPQDAP